MCLLFVYVNDDLPEGSYKLILASNRDELWSRPTATADWRTQDGHNWMGGMDLQPGKETGTWLGISESGKIAALLNIMAKQRTDARGRGSLVKDFLAGDQSCEEYIQSVSMEAGQYNPFHLFVLDLRRSSMHSLTHPGREAERTIIKSYSTGVFGGDNTKNLDLPWRKREEGQKLFSDIVHRYGQPANKYALVTNIFQMLSDSRQTEKKSQKSPIQVIKQSVTCDKYFPDQRLEQQFEGLEHKTEDLKMQRSAIFVFSPQYGYGTRTSTVILVDKHGKCEYIEKTLETPVQGNKIVWNTKVHEFTISAVQL